MKISSPSKILRACILAGAVLFILDSAANAQPAFSPSSWLRRTVVNEPDAVNQQDAADILHQVNYDANGVAKTANNKTYLAYSNAMPIWTASASITPIAVIDRNDGFCNPLWSSVPWPTYASAGTSNSDHHCMIWQPTSDTLWEFQSTETTGAYVYPNITATHGGRMLNCSTASGIYPVPYGAPACGISLAAGLITLDEARAVAADPDNYVIPHVLAIGLPRCELAHLAPANRHDATAPPASDSIPEGRRFRLPANYDMSLLANKAPIVRAIARTARDYGMIVRDQTASIVIVYVQDSKTCSYEGETSPWGSVLGGKASYNVLDDFPWGSLKALNPTYNVEPTDPPESSSGEAHAIIADAAEIALNGNLASFSANGVGDYVVYNLGTLAAGSYRVYAGVKLYSARGNYQTALALTGSGVWTNVGTAMSQYAATASYPEQYIGTYTAGSTGIHKIRFTVTGKNASSTAYSLLFDYIRLMKTN